jgi:hypothetical protein
MDDFWSTGIYIVITVGALLVAMIVILLLTATAKPKKSRKRVKGQAGKKLAAPGDLMLLAEGGAKDDKKGKNNKKGKPPRPEKQAKKSKQEKQEEERQRKEEKQAARQEDKQPLAAAAAGEEVKAPVEENVTVAELPSVDTLDDSDDGTGEAAANEDLMSIFQVEEAEDSYVSDLANKLFDVETSNIQALGLEVLSVFSRGKAAVETKEDENE